MSLPGLSIHEKNLLLYFQVSLWSTYLIVFINVLKFSTAKIVLEARVEAVAADSVVTVATKAVEADGETRVSSRTTMAMMEATRTNTKEVEIGIKVVVVETGIKEVKSLKSLLLLCFHMCGSVRSGRTQVLYKARVLYCALFSRSFFSLEIAFWCFIFWKMCFIFVSCLSGWNFYLKFLFKTLK